MYLITLKPAKMSCKLEGLVKKFEEAKGLTSVLFALKMIKIFFKDSDKADNIRFLQRWP